MRESRTVLLLGGTSEAYALAEKFAEEDYPVLSSLAGRTSHPKIPAGRYRIGGFGGIDGLIDTIKKENIGLIVDATHPFAETMTDHAWRAARAKKIDYIRFERPFWQAGKEDKWLTVNNIEEAVAAIPLNSRCFLAIGRQHVNEFLVRKDVSFVARMVEKPENFVPEANIEIVLGKPENEKEEYDFLVNHHFDCLVCRNSGGSASFPKLEAARKLGLPVIMITRKPLPDVVILNTEKDVIDLVRTFCQADRAEKHKETNG
ncbi:cobalt-precorrin-6A reductase [Bartonella apis]|uniref:cobalt-precorrin-6A reductase n=1 Tax=Bartonella apis TaxID=1686310 RepID=UPI0024327AFE|nr:cobalt-precorrin-6A reductase [Bartonella apis]